MNQFQFLGCLMKQHDLTWGESVAVREAFLDQNKLCSVQFGLKELLEMDYTPFSGDEVLIDHTRKIIKRQTGMSYKHVFLTNGASGGCTVALRAYGKLGYDTVVTNPAPFFTLYPAMADAAGLTHMTRKPIKNSWDPGSVFLLDTPANPSGKHVSVPDWAQNKRVIWDSVYHSRVYCGVLPPPPNHDIAVGSYSKLTGINGIRLGWIATNHDLEASIVEELIAPEYCGLSKPSMAILSSLLYRFNIRPDYWSSFEKQARYKLDCNRTEWARLEKYFGNSPVPTNGMFYYGPMDEGCKRLMEKAGISYKPGSECGHSDDFGRFNLGQKNEIIASAVKNVLKMDKIK